MKEEAVYRYPGCRPFQDSEVDRLLFKGREYEKQVLLHQVMTESPVVFYSKTGVGKTSLLNSGLLPLLREEGYFPFIARFNICREDPIQLVYHATQEEADKR